MKVETMIYIYIVICLSLIVFNCAYVFVIKRNANKLDKETDYFYFQIREQLARIEREQGVDQKHIKMLCKKLKTTSKLAAFDKSMADIYNDTPQEAKKYLHEIHSVFTYLTKEYKKSETVKTAYFPYIISKYEILKNDQTNTIQEFLFELLHSRNVYCRENALKAIYSMGNADYVAEALKIIDKNLSFHHPKLVCDGLFAFDGDKNELAKKLWSVFEGYSVQMQVNIMNFIRFAGIRNDNKIFEIMVDEEKNQELRFSAIRYFEKFPLDTVCEILQNFAENKENRAWEYQAISSSALKSYPGEKTTKILINNLSNSNWYVRLNSAISCEKLGYSYSDLIEVFDGSDRYAREMLRYRLDKRAAEKEVATV